MKVIQRIIAYRLIVPSINWMNITKNAITVPMSCKHVNCSLIESEELTHFGELNIIHYLEISSIMDWKRPLA